MLRNRAQTEQRLIDAVGELITEAGINGVRINRVASRSGVNKILIYRYFGGIDGLRQAYIERTEPAVSLPLVDIEALKRASVEVIFETFCEYAIEEYRLLRQNPQAQAVLRANLLTEDNLFNLLVNEKAHHYQTMVDELGAVLGTQYGRPFTALINSGLTLLTLLSEQKRTAFGFDLSTDTAWIDIEITLRHLFRGCYLYTIERLNQEAQATSSPTPHSEQL